MSLTYGGTTYRSLEEQVRKNMEDISTEAESLAALTDKVDNLQTGGTKVSLTFPAGASSGTVTDEQLATLQENDANYIEMVNDKELYYLNDPGHEEGYLTYSHVGIENSKATIKTLTITVSAKSFVIVTTVIDAGGSKVYKHNVELDYVQNTSPFTTLYVYLTFYNSSADKITKDQLLGVAPSFQGALLSAPPGSVGLIYNNPVSFKQVGLVGSVYAGTLIVGSTSLDISDSTILNDITVMDTVTEL